MFKNNTALNQIKKDLISTINMVTSKTSSQVFDGKMSFGTIYPYTTEDIATYLNAFNNPKDVLTVIGSGDQIINCILKGSTNITGYDTNNLAKYGLALKLAAIKGLPLEEFQKYYLTFDQELYAKIRVNLDFQNQFYWDMIYQIFSPKIILFKIFKSLKFDHDLIVSINPYLQGSNFNIIKEALRNTNIELLDLDLYSLITLPRTFDGMIFSNIYEHLCLNSEIGTTAEAKKYYHFLQAMYSSKLNYGGTIQATYFYAFSSHVRKYLNSVISYNPNIYKDLMYNPNEKFPDTISEQNLSYMALLEQLEDDNYELIETDHVRYGNSFDKSHDQALILKKSLSH